MTWFIKPSGCTNQSTKLVKEVLDVVSKSCPISAELPAFWTRFNSTNTLCTTSFYFHAHSEQPALSSCEKRRCKREKKTTKQVPVGSWPSSFPVVQLIIPNMCCIMHKTICSLFLMSMNIKTACCSLVHVVYSCSCVCQVMRLTSKSRLKSSKIIN